MTALEGVNTNRLMSKVPEVTIFFWIIKVLATTVGETGADFLSVTLNLGLNATSYVMGAMLLIALVAQFRSTRYVPWIYWITTVLISVVGTLITDNLVDGFGISLTFATIIFSFVLAVTFATWFVSERTLSIHSIYTTRRELFYWTAILFTFALGTAAGDLMAESLGLGYGLSALVFGGLIAAVTAAYYLFKANAVLAFWIAYILTRPLGASFGDLLSQPVGNGGIGLGTVGTSLIFVFIIVSLVFYLTISRNRHALARNAV